MVTFEEWLYLSPHPSRAGSPWHSGVYFIHQREQAGSTPANIGSTMPTETAVSGQSYVIQPPLPTTLESRGLKRPAEGNPFNITAEGLPWIEQFRRTKEQTDGDTLDTNHRPFASTMVD
jgi:hypothetical protein